MQAHPAAVPLRCPALGMRAYCRLCRGGRRRRWSLGLRGAWQERAPPPWRARLDGKPPALLCFAGLSLDIGCLQSSAHVRPSC